MAVGQIRASNNPLPAAQVETAKKSLWSRFSSSISSLWPVQGFRAVVTPTTCPNETLKRTAQAAERSLEWASAANIRVQPHTARLHGAIDQALANRTRIPTAGTAPIRQTPADITDPDVTPVPHIRRHVETVDWKEQIQVNKARLTQKLSAFSILMRMRDHIGAPNENNLKLLNIVKLYTEGTHQDSLWTLFTSHYELSFLQTLKALWIYWFYYMTSLIGNTIDAYLGSFIESSTAELTSENSNVRSLILQSMLRNINQFLVGDIQASKAFAEGTGYGDLADYQDREIERHYGFSLSELCRAFSEKRVEESPRVRFFRDFQEIPILGWLFVGVEWILNQFIIRWNMRSWILPGVMKSAVDKGLEATQPHNIPFSLSMTRFITSQLERLFVVLQEESSEGDVATEHLPGTELLGATIKNLKTVLALEPHNTSLELRKKFEELEAGEGTLKAKVAESIEQGINDAGHILFHYLNDTARSGELFARMLELSCQPFSGEVSNLEDLVAEYEEEQRKLERTAKVVFKELVQKSVSKVFKSQGSGPLAMNSFRRQKCVSLKTVEELNRVCVNMSAKVEAAAQGPTAENDVQTDITELLQIMQVFASRKEFQEKIEGINGVDQNEIWRVFSPIFDQAKNLQQRVIHLQTQQHYYPSHAAVEENLREIHELLQAISEQFQAQPRHLQNPLMQTLNKLIDEVVLHLGRDAPISIYLRNLSTHLADLFRDVSKRQQSLDALEAIYVAPIRVLRPGQEMELGILDQIVAYEQGNPPPNFRLSYCLEQLRTNITHLPEGEERTQIQQLIGDGRNLGPKIPQLTRLIAGMYRSIYLSKRQSLIALNTCIDDAVREIRGKTASYRNLKEQNYASLRAEMNLIRRDLQNLTKVVQNVEVRFSSSSWWPHIFGGGVALVGASLGGLAGTSISGLVGGSLGSLMGSAFSLGSSVSSGLAGGLVSNYLAEGKGNQSDELEESSVRKWSRCLIPLGIGVTASSWLSGGAVLGSLPFSWQAAAVGAGGFGTGWKAYNATQSHFEKEVFDQVWDIFTNAYSLGLHPRIWKMALTRTMKAMVDGN